MNKKIIVIVLINMSILCGCSKSQSINNIKTFEKDDNTITKAEYIQYQNNIVHNDEKTEEHNDYDVVEYNYDGEQLGIITLLNSDNSTDFIVDNSNIIYNDTIYYNIMDAMQYIELPDGISETTFINFLIKIIEPQGKNIIISYDSDKVDHSSEDDTSLDIPQQFFGISKYNNIVSKYGKDVTWEIHLYDKDYNTFINMYGCDKYIFMMHASDATYDMSLYNHGDTETEILEEQEEQEEQIEEQEEIINSNEEIKNEEEKSENSN